MIHIKAIGVMPSLHVFTKVIGMTSHYTKAIGIMSSLQYVSHHRYKIFTKAIGITPSLQIFTKAIGIMPSLQIFTKARATTPCLTKVFTTALLTCK